MAARNRFKQLHLDMTACFDREQRAGWQSPEVENYATRVRNYLWEIANNEKPHHSAFKGLAEDTENLAKARAK